MTQSYNLSQLANNLNTAGQLDATDGLVGAVPPANGGTGQSAYTTGDILYASGTTALARLPDVATGNVLISGGVGASPSYAKVGLTTHVSGTLPIANGGTNSTATPTAGGVIYGTGTAYAATAAGTTGQVLTSAASGAPTWTSSQSIGIGQSWQNVTRTAGTTYTNTTGRPIVTQCVVQCSSTQSYTLTVGSVVVAYYQGFQASAIAGTIGAIVPPGATYVFTYSGALPTIVNQIELF